MYKGQLMPSLPDMPHGADGCYEIRVEGCEGVPHLIIEPDDSFTRSISVPIYELVLWLQAQGAPISYEKVSSEVEGE